MALTTLFIKKATGLQLYNNGKMAAKVFAGSSSWWAVETLLPLYRRKEIREWRWLRWNRGTNNQKEPSS